MTDEARRCKPRTSTPVEIRDGDDDDDDVIVVDPVIADENIGGGISNDSMTPTAVNPLFVMTGWRDPKSRDGRLAVLVGLPTVSVDREDGAKQN